MNTRPKIIAARIGPAAPGLRAIPSHAAPPSLALSHTAAERRNAHAQARGDCHQALCSTCRGLIRALRECGRRQQHYGRQRG